MFVWFEKMLHPYQEEVLAPPPSGFIAFVWACTKGARRYLAAMTLLTAAIGVFEALLFAMMGRIVDWLSTVQPALLWTQERTHLLMLAGVLILSVALVALQTLFKHQALSGNFPCLLYTSPSPRDQRGSRMPSSA